MTTAVQVQYRRGTASQVAAFTGAQGELVVDTTNNRVVVQDGATAGGFAAAKLTDIGTVTALHGSTIQTGVVEDLIACSGASSVSTVTIPNRAIVCAVSTNVVTAITGATWFNADATTSAGGGAGTTAGEFGSILGTPPDRAIPASSGRPPGTHPRPSSSRPRAAASLAAPCAWRSNIYYAARR